MTPISCTSCILYSFLVRSSTCLGKMQCKKILILSCVLFGSIDVILAGVTKYALPYWIRVKGLLPSRWNDYWIDILLHYSLVPGKSRHGIYSQTNFHHQHHCIFPLWDYCSKEIILRRCNFHVNGSRRVNLDIESNGSLSEQLYSYTQLVCVLFFFLWRLPIKRETN
jgi:hypothetical protein